MALDILEGMIIELLYCPGMPPTMIRDLLGIDMRTLTGYVKEKGLKVSIAAVNLGRKETPQHIHRQAQEFMRTTDVVELTKILIACDEESKALLIREIARTLETTEHATAGKGNGHNGGGGRSA